MANLFDQIAALFGPSQPIPTPQNLAPGTLKQFTPQGANLVNPVTGQMAINATGDVASQLAAQRGALGQTQGLYGQLAGQGGIGNQANVFNQQQALADALRAQAMGGGPNPAQQALNQATAQNIRNQAALMAGQRGAGANAGLLARQIANQGAQTQQQAVGQSALMQAQQQLGAQQALQNQLAGMGQLAGTQVGQQMMGAQNVLGGQQNLTQAQQAQQQALLNAINAQNQGNIAMQSNLNQGNLGMTENLNNIAAAMQQNINNANAGIAQQQAQQGSNVLGGLLGAGAQIGAAALMNQGGQVENKKLAKVPEGDRYPGSVQMPPHFQKIAELYHGNQYRPQAYAQGGSVGSKLKEGGKVPGQAKMKGDHPINDTVSAKLSPGEVVIPKSVMESRDPVGGAAQFVANLENKKANSYQDDHNDFKKALAKAISERKKKS